jgi:hypothetical protein
MQDVAYELFRFGGMLLLAGCLVGGVVCLLVMFKMWWKS